MTDPAERPPTRAQTRFAEAAPTLLPLDLAERFRRIRELDLWGGDESMSGPGSGLEPTARLRAELPPLLRELEVGTLLDAPCGDFHWMRHVDLAGIRYVGGDIVPELVARNTELFATPDGTRRFVTVDLTAGPLPPADAVLCRDCLVHLSYANIGRALDRIRESGARWLLTTTFTALERNTDVPDGDWRPLNLERAPFGFGRPEAMIVEGCDEEGGAYADKTLGVWRVAALPPGDEIGKAARR
jgi:hypothetical protein